ncbi:unnamed protein product [Rhizophagus irregularis]|nr:unnamed protein product [Rhizophagus irregularis]
MLSLIRHIRKFNVLTTRVGESEENYDRDVDVIENTGIFYGVLSLKKAFETFFRCSILILTSFKKISRVKSCSKRRKRDFSVFISDKRSGCYIYEMIDAEIIFLGELRIDKKYGGIQVNIGLYQFALIDDENEKNGISDWKTLEKWYQLSTRRMPMLILI